MSTWLIGAGAMARDYAKVMLALDHRFEVIGRNVTSAEKFASATGLAVRQGGIRDALAASAAPEQAIVAVGVEELAGAARALVEAGTRRILVEKPGGLNTPEIRALQQIAATRKAKILIAYNRRFYASTIRARELIASDGGATSCIFEFTEWPHVIAPLRKPPEVKAAWFLANSTHVVDLAFHLCGFPQEWQAWQGGSLDWHPSAARFCGSGRTEHGVLFSYYADWEAPGRWGLEVLTRKRRFVFKPIEQLQVLQQGSVTLERVEIDDGRDKAFKPGLFLQTEAFLTGNDSVLCTIEQQLRHCAVYDRMTGEARLSP